MPNQLAGATDLHARARTALERICRLVDLDATDAELLRLRSNAVFKLRAPIVVRIATSPNAAERLPAVLAVTRWLAGRGFPTVQPADEVNDQPVTLDNVTATFWRYVPSSATPVHTSELGRVLRDLHATPPPSFPIKTLTDPLASIRTTVTHHPGILTADERTWLSQRIAALTSAWNELPFAAPPALVHGDAWIENLLRHRDGHVVLGDWDSVAIGPREWDLIHNYHGQRRFGLSPSDVDAFATAYGYDLRDWSGYDTLMQIRDVYAIGIHIRNAPGDPFSRHELSRRLTSLRNDTTHTRWQMKHE
ncbi:phosphotransferase enzyme family protein [Actinomadura fibrosa]|uniref:Phosphotransferase enzyme family protein n=1 Tax=Actinomadura fibrosa TaxID=111802 RepID=A0ABW2XZR2_9ACTN|nr:aminoglycoside phosphotransferase family protein [Actinomadura fibrosa]